MALNDQNQIRWIRWLNNYDNVLLRALINPNLTHEQRDDAIEAWRQYDAGAPSAPSGVQHEARILLRHAPVFAVWRQPVSDYMWEYVKIFFTCCEIQIAAQSESELSETRILFGRIINALLNYAGLIEYYTERVAGLRLFGIGRAVHNAATARPNPFLFDPGVSEEELQRRAQRLTNLASYMKLHLLKGSAPSDIRDQYVIVEKEEHVLV